MSCVICGERAKMEGSSRFSNLDEWIIDIWIIIIIISTVIALVSIAVTYLLWNFKNNKKFESNMNSNVGRFSQSTI